jgi:hypothetical protein
VAEVIALPELLAQALQEPVRLRALRVRLAVLRPVKDVVAVAAPVRASSPNRVATRPAVRRTTALPGVRA